MTTRLFEILVSDLQVHHDHFLACHQKNMPGNLLAVVKNVAGDRCLVKINCDDPIDTISGSCPVFATYNVEQAVSLLQTAEWKSNILV